MKIVRLISSTISDFRSTNPSANSSVEVRIIWVERDKDVALRAKISVGHKLRPEPCRFSLTEFELSPMDIGADELGEPDPVDSAELDAEILLEFRLKRPRLLFVGLVCDHRQPVDPCIMNPFAISVDRQAQPAADFLALSFHRLRFIQSTDLEDIRIIPAFT